MNFEPARLDLDGEWSFKGFLGSDWDLRRAMLPDTRDRLGWLNGCVPGSVIHDLWLNHEIPDPNFERNSLLAEWAAQRTWVYKRSFPTPDGLDGRRVRIVFEGVDYSARFFLNGVELGSHTGMFTPASFEVTEYLIASGENLLAVVIDPAPDEQPQVGYTSRVRTHKTRMNYWWDFCPRLVHQGIWDRVYLEVTGGARIEDVFVRPRLSAGFDMAETGVSIELSSLAAAQADVQVEIRLEDQVVAAHALQAHLEPGATHLNASLEIQQPSLWWPNGSGDQPLYTVEVIVSCHNEISDRRQVTFGIREITFTANTGSPADARPYTLVVNGQRIFINGWNWVPVDALYGVERPEKLEHLLSLAQRAHVNMLRVWGGGLIEKQAFYEQCDRLGILVWQEFIQSSSGIENQPSSDPDHIARMAAEARQIIPRRRNHPSLAVWCGGNELSDSSQHPLDDTHPLLAALKAEVQTHDPDRTWLPTSPSGPTAINSLENIHRDPAGQHDVHGPWEYQGLSEHYELYNKGTSLLHSEFGVEGITNLKTLIHTVSEQHRYPASLEDPVWMHRGHWWIKEDVWQAAFGSLPDTETSVRAVQFLQASGLAYAVEADRRRQFHCSGTLPWQFNESYPMAACTSAVDYYAQPKPVYYTVARAYQPLRLVAGYPTIAWGSRDTFTAEPAVINNCGKTFINALAITKLVTPAGDIYKELHLPVNIQAGSVVDLDSIDWDLRELEDDIFFMDLTLLSNDGELLTASRHVFSRADNLAPLLSRPAAELKTTCLASDDTWEVTLSNIGAEAAVNVWLQSDRPVDAAGWALFSDNYFSLLPNEERTITVSWSAIPHQERGLEISAWNAPMQRMRA